MRETCNLLYNREVIIRYYLQMFGINALQSSINNSNLFFFLSLQLYKCYKTRKIQSSDEVRVIAMAALHIFEHTIICIMHTRCNIGMSYIHSLYLYNISIIFLQYKVYIYRYTLQLCRIITIVVGILCERDSCRHHRKS